MDKLAHLQVICDQVSDLSNFFHNTSSIVATDWQICVEKECCYKREPFGLETRLCSYVYTLDAMVYTSSFILGRKFLLSTVAGDDASKLELLVTAGEEKSSQFSNIPGFFIA